MPIQFVLTLILLSAIAVTWKRISEKVITVKEGIFWSCIWLGALVIILIPSTTSVIARWLGVGRGADLVLYASVIALFLFVFKLYVSLDKVDHKLTELVRREALKGLKDEKEVDKSISK